MIEFGANQVETYFKNSFTAWSVNQLLEWRNESEGCLRILKQFAAEPAFIALTVIGVIETVVRTILAGLVKIFDLFVSDKSCIFTASDYLVDSVNTAGLGTCLAAFEILGNWYSHDGELETGRAICKSNDEFYKNYVRPVSDYRLCQ